MANGDGGSYSYTDAGAKAGRSYTYWLVEVGLNGQQRVYASATLTAEGCAASIP